MSFACYFNCLLILRICLTVMSPKFIGVIMKYELVELGVHLL